MWPLSQAQESILTYFNKSADMKVCFLLYELHMPQYPKRHIFKESLIPWHLLSLVRTDFPIKDIYS